MRAPQVAIAVATLGLLALIAAAPAQAQVTVNPGALDLLPSQPARRTHSPAPAANPNPRAPNAARHPAGARPNAPANAAPAGATTTPAAPTTAAPPPAAAAIKPVLPTVPPAIAALPPPSPVPPPRAQTAPTVQVATDAPGNATPVPGGLRVTFGAERQDLNPTTEAALRALAKQLRPRDGTTINIYAYAAGTPEDLSTARRLALARALSARAVLINEGIASTRIYPRALGNAGGDTDKDRVDVVAGPPGPPASASPPSVAPPPAAPPK